MGKIIVVDSDAVFALYNPNDPLNIKATRVFGQLTAKGFRLVYPSSVIFEVISLFQRVLPTPAVTKKLIEMIQNETLVIQIVNEQILKETTVIFNPAGSKKNTLIDCSVAAVARKIKAAGIFSYDSFYTKLGLKLAEDLI